MAKQLDNRPEAGTCFRELYKQDQFSSLAAEMACLMQAELHGVLPVNKVLPANKGLLPANKGVVPVNQSQFGTLQQTAVHWSSTLKQAAAVCNSLTMVNKHTVAGVDVERSLFKAVEARFKVRCYSCLHCKPGYIIYNAKVMTHIACEG